MKRMILMVVAALGACTVEREVLDIASGVATTCDEVWAAGATACALEGECRRPTPGDEPCCTQIVRCMAGELVREESCRPECICAGHDDCGRGSLCTEQRCLPCPPVAPVCPPCPPGWIHLGLNGCPTCQCGPPPECDEPGAACDGPLREICYRGQTCASGCDATDLGCCSNTCAAPSCPSPAPRGCWTACVSQRDCATCATDTCECRAGVWVCTDVCAERVPVTCRHMNP